jgi:hypothetical protein
VEAIDETGNTGLEKLKEQCNKYFLFLGLEKSDLVDKSYSDLIV